MCTANPACQILGGPAPMRERAQPNILPRGRRAARRYAVWPRLLRHVLDPSYTDEYCQKQRYRPTQKQTGYIVVGFEGNLDQNLVKMLSGRCNSTPPTRIKTVRNDRKILHRKQTDPTFVCSSRVRHDGSLIGTDFNLRTTTLHKCAVVPRRARI